MGMALGGEVEVQGFLLVNPQLPELQNWVPADIVKQEQPLRGFIILGEDELQTSHEPLLDLLKTLNAHNIPFELELRANTGDEPASASADLGYALNYLLGA